MMSRLFQRELRHIEQELLTLSAIVEESVVLAVRATQNRDSALAEDVEARDADVDRREVELEEECLKILALHQPVAVDLRMVVSMLKINNDLERVGDLAVSIARCARKLCLIPGTAIPSDMKPMADKAIELFGRSLDCFVKLDADVARNVCEGDAEVDAMYDTIIQEIIRSVHQDSNAVEQGMLFFRIARALERVGDHASNIAEDVIYMLEGGIVRHQS